MSDTIKDVLNALAAWADRQNRSGAVYITFDELAHGIRTAFASVAVAATLSEQEGEKLVWPPNESCVHGYPAFGDRCPICGNGSLTPESVDVVTYLRSGCNLIVNHRCDTVACMRKNENGHLVHPIEFIGCWEKRAADLIERLVRERDELSELNNALCDNEGKANLRAEAAEAEVKRLREEIVAETLRYASHYPQSSDGRNTFTLLADWIKQHTAIIPEKQP